MPPPARAEASAANGQRKRAACSPRQIPAHCGLARHSGSAGSQLQNKNLNSNWPSGPGPTCCAQRARHRQRGRRGEVPGVGGCVAKAQDPAHHRQVVLPHRVGRGQHHRGRAVADGRGVAGCAGGREDEGRPAAAGVCLWAGRRRANPQGKQAAPRQIVPARSRTTSGQVQGRRVPQAARAPVMVPPCGRKKGFSLRSLSAFILAIASSCTRGPQSLEARQAAKESKEATGKARACTSCPISGTVPWRPRPSGVASQRSAPTPRPIRAASTAGPHLLDQLHAAALGGHLHGCHLPVEQAGLGGRARALHAGDGVRVLLLAADAQLLGTHLCGGGSV